ncbi:helix-turn-helix transcriptional regulator [Streptomyces sp. Pv4-95]|uniref:XRE family transcriptional regulator n=1 Tax=Streptomyces sp. Pv4-95 TaxID=3049543 RepID=UPI0038929C5F
MNDLIAHPLAYARHLAGKSQAQLIRGMHDAARREGLRCGADKAAVSRWEHYVKSPDRDSQLLIARVLGVPAGHLSLYPWPDWLPGMEEPLPLGPAYTLRALHDAQKATMDRRSFMSLSTASMAGLASQWATIEPGHLASALDRRKRVDAELLDWLEGTSNQLNALPTERRQHAIRLMDAQLATVTDLLTSASYTAPLGRRLHLLAASLATTCGWYRFDQGRHYAAGKMWTGALHAATAAGDKEFGAGVLSDFGYQSLWTGRPKAAVDHLGLALSGTQHPTARALLHLRRSRAYAALGDRDATLAGLTDAEHALDEAEGTTAPAWCAWMSRADLEVDSGQALLDLGDTRRAQTRIAAGIALLPPTRDKTRGVFLASQAKAALNADDVEYAAHLAGQSLDIASRIGAERCVTQVRGLARHFTKHRNVEGVSDLLHRLQVA